jgi:hypothetical protein
LPSTFYLCNFSLQKSKRKLVPIASVEITLPRKQKGKKFLFFTLVLKHSFQASSVYEKPHGHKRYALVFLTLTSSKKVKLAKKFQFKQ